MRKIAFFVFLSFSIFANPTLKNEPTETPSEISGRPVVSKECVNGVCYDVTKFYENKIATIDGDRLRFLLDKNPQLRCIYEPGDKGKFYRIRKIREYPQSYMDNDIFYSQIIVKEEIIIKKVSQRNFSIRGYMVDCAETPYERYKEEVKKSLTGVRDTAQGRYPIINVRYGKY